MAVVVKNFWIEPRANQIARQLYASGLRTGDVVVSLLPNCPESVYSYRAVTCSGLIWTPVNTQLPVDDVRYIVENSGATAIILHSDYAAVAAQLSDELSSLVKISVGDDVDGFSNISTSESLPCTAFEHRGAGEVMMYTSGTTGRPKGVKRSTELGGPLPCFISDQAIMAMRDILGDSAGGVHLVAAPLYHSAPSLFCDGAAQCGADIVIMERWDTEEFLSLVNQYAVVSTFLVPTHLVRLIRLPPAVRERYSTESLKALIHGGGPIQVDVKRRVIEWLGLVVYEAYAGTEGGGMMISAEEWLAHPGSVGKPSPQFDLKIIDREGKLCQPGKPGLIYIKGQSSFEYLDAPDKTASVKNGRHITLGDIGYLDDSGYLYLCDRKSDLIVSGGVNVYPVNIENVLSQHPLVEECCVIGLPDEEWGEIVCAVFRPITSIDNETQVFSDIRAFCKQRLATHEVPKLFRIDSTLERNALGKLPRHKVREKYRQPDHF